MAKSSIKIRAKASGGITTVKSLMSHPMETGLRKDKTTGELVPAHFIQEVVAELNGKAVMTCYWGGAVSKNPYLSFKIKGGAAGDEVKLTWTDNKGDSDSQTAKIS